MPQNALRAIAGQRLLSVDLGGQYCGLAVRECKLLGAQAYGVLVRTPPRLGGSVQADTWLLRRGAKATGKREQHPTLAEALVAVARERRVGGLILGMPYVGDGGQGVGCAAAARTAGAVQAAWPDAPPVVLWDESWSTRLAVGTPRSRDPPRDALWTHSAAAQFLLQEVLLALQPLEPADAPLHSTLVG